MKEQFISHITYNIFTSMYNALLLGGEFSNCYGQGSTPENAINSLRLRVIQLRNKRIINN